MQAPASATIIVLDDSAAVLELIEAVLTGAGHHVLGTQDAAEVLRLAERVRIDLLIGPAVTLRRDPELLDHLHALQGELRVLYLSRRTANERMTLQTPFTLQELRVAVDRVLDARSVAD